MKLIIFDQATGRHLREFGFDDIGENTPMPEVAVGAGEVLEVITDSVVLHKLESEDVQRIGNQLVFTPKLPYIPDYRELRRSEYPPLGDQLDAILKHLEPQVLPGTDLERVVENWRQIKARYP
ncbi:MAG: hypothetical protein ACYC0N_03625, partial [Carboxydocellales bacterium]